MNSGRSDQSCDISVYGSFHIKLCGRSAIMSLFDDLDETASNHWVNSDSGSEGLPVSRGGSVTSPSGSVGGFDPAVARPIRRVSSPSTPGTPSPVLNTTKYQPTNPVTKLTREDSFFCKVCKIDLSGVEPARQHYAGKQHKKALVKAGELGATRLPLRCDVCQKDFTGEASAQQHFISSKHQKAVQGAETYARSLVEQGQVGVSLPDAGTPHSASSWMASQGTVFSLGRGVSRSPGVVSQGRASSLPVGKPSQAAALMPADSTMCGSFLLPTISVQGTLSSHDVSDVSSENSSLDEEHSRRLFRSSAADTPNVNPTRGPQAVVQKHAGVPSALSGASGTDQERQRHLKLRIESLCSTVLEDYMRRIIPIIAEKVADTVLQELSQTPGSGTATMPSTTSSRQGGSQEELVSLNSDCQSMPSLVESLSAGVLDGKTLGDVGQQNDLNKPSSDRFSNLWESLTEKNKAGSP